MIRARLLILAAVCYSATGAESPGQTGDRPEFHRLIAHWTHYARPDYLTFVSEARPEVVQVGFYGAHFWSLVHTAEFGGYPAHFPVRGIAEASQWFADLNGKLHGMGAKVIGHFNVEMLVGDPDSPEGPRGFFRFYRDLWDEQVLGPKPHPDPTSLLERDAAGRPIVNRTYAIGGMNEYWACLRNPAWQQVLKAWVRRGIELGLDGYMINYFYRHNCLCEHCTGAFRDYLRKRFDKKELAGQFGINDLDRHEFTEIVSWHDPAETTPLRREMLRFSQISNKQVFDDVFIAYGRSVKPDLIVGQWNHLGDFSQISGDERCLLPAELWGRNEDYLWYSTGGAAYYTDLSQRFLGEATLQARFIRGAFDDKPFTLGKYEQTRVRAAVAELAANGGAPMGFYSDFTNPESRRVLVQYYSFLNRHSDVFRANRSHAEVMLLFPRRAVHAGDLQPLERFRTAGRALLDRHVLFDILPDDLATPQRTRSYQIVDPSTGNLDESLGRLQPASRFEAPYTVRVSASRPMDDTKIHLHFVNYNRQEPPRGADGKPSAGSGAQDEKPIAASGVTADFALPPGRHAAAVHVITPEQPDPNPLAFESNSGRVSFAVPDFLVYAIAEIKLEPVP